jgi:hypothetical protein
MSNTDGSDLVVDIEKLALNNNFYDWFVTTNKLIDAVNPLNIYDITARKGLTESRANGHVILDVDSGKGIKTFPDDGTGKVTLDFESLTEKASPLNDDLFVIEQPATGNSNNVYKIFATNMLPPTLTGNHIFTGTITVSALNVNDNVIRLQYGDTTTENDSGLILDTTTSSKVKFTYDNAIQAWFSNKNLGLNNGYSFVTNSGERRANFKFGTYGSNQYDTGLELMMGQNSTQGDDKSFIIEGRNSSKSFEFIYKDYTNTDTETTLFYSQVETTNPVTSTFKVTDKIQIGNVLGSTTNFKTITDYSTSIIPISNSNGILDSKWTNRYVTSTYSAGIVVGDVIKILNDTNNQATIVKCALTSSSTEDEAYSIGIVERISGGKVWVVTHGEFGGLTGLDPGAVYYLTTGTPNYTLTKPTTGIVKPVFVATSATGGVLFPMSAQGVSFGKVGVVNAAGGTVITTTGTTVTSDSPNDLFTLDAGSGISLETDTSNNKIIIRAASAGNQPTYSTIVPNSGDTVSAINPGETLTLQGLGGIEVIGDNNTVGDILNIRGKYFRTVSWSGESTNDVSGTYTATSFDDTLNVYAGVGINVSPHPSGGGFRIDATGTAISTVAVNSQELDIFKVSTGDSVLGYFGGATPSAVTKLSPTVNSILGSTSASRIEWQSVATHLQQKLAATEPTNFVPSFSPNEQVNNKFYGLTTTTLPGTKTPNTLQRVFGIVALPKNSTSAKWLLPTNVAGFKYSDDSNLSANNVNGALLGLLEGNGIQLETLNSVYESISGIPSIKITNKYGSAFSRVKILDTSETIKATPTETKTVTNYIAYSDPLGFGVNYSNAAIFGGTSGVPNAGSGGNSIGYGPYLFGSSPNSSVISTTGPFGTTVSAVNIEVSSSSSGGMYYGIPFETYSAGKTYTVSVYAKTTTSKSDTKFRINFFDVKTASVYSSSEEFTTGSSWTRYTFTFKTIETYSGTYPSGGGSAANNVYSQASNRINKPGHIYFAGNPATARYSSFISPHFSINLSSGQSSSNAIDFYGLQLEEGFEASDYVSSGAFGSSSFNWSPGATNVSTFDPLLNSWSYNFRTSEFVKPESHGTLNFSTQSSPIFIDSDTNSSTIYFNIATNSITNNYLATMADNTVKVGTGSTNSDNTPQDLAIGTNSILGRVGSGDLKSVNMTELGAMLGTTQFTTVQTDDSGTLLPSESTTIRLKGGTGIVTSIGTNNEIIITSTGGGGGGSIGFVGDWDGSTSFSSVSGAFTKLLFQDGDLNYTTTTSGSDGAVVQSNLNWQSSSWGGSSNGGPGLIFGQGVKNAGTSALSTKLSQVGNGKQNSQLPFITVPSDGTTLASLSYIGRESSGQTNSVDRVVGFKSDGTLVATDQFVAGLTFDSTKITGLSASVSAGQISITVPTNDIVKFPNISSTNGFYFGESNNLGLVMDDTGTDGRSDFIFATAELGTSYSSSFTNSTYITSINFGGAGLSTTSGGTQTVRPVSTTLKTRYFGDNGGWSNISGTALPRICMPENGFMIGDGPTNSSSSLSSGIFIRNDTTNSALTFTNYNFTQTGTARTLAKDRSTRIGLEVLSVPASGTSSTNYTSSANTAYITHSVVPSGSTTVDQFAVPPSSKKSYKYFIHAQDSSGDFFTTELVVQVKASPTAISTTNIIQYGSTTTNSTTLPTVTFSLNTSTLTVTLTSSSSSLDYKVLKYEI